MFKLANSENEISSLMEKKLLSLVQSNRQPNLDKLSRATDYLNEAADIFEKVGMKTTAIEVMEVLHNLVAQLSKQ